MDNPALSKNNPFSAKQFNALVLSALVSIIWMWFLNFDTTALAWPAVDNLPGVCRLLDPACLLNDFFTNASSTTNPRSPYIHILASLSDYSGLGLGGGLGIVKGLLLVLMPLVFTMIMVISVKLNVKDSDVIFYLSCLLAPLVIYLLQGKVGYVLSVAWWSPINFEATPHNVALTFTLLGFCFHHFKRLFLCAVFISFATIIHPIMGLFTSVFGLLLFSNFSSLKANKNLFLYGLLPSVVTALGVKILFDANTALSVEEFVRIYVKEAHPAHYLPSQFGSFGVPLAVSFGAVIGGLMLVSGIFYKLKKGIWKKALTAAAFYGLAVLFQYIFVELWPVKLIAKLGPSRFTMFGIWFLFIFWGVLIFDFVADRVSLNKLSSFLQWSHRVNRRFVGGALLVLLGLFVGTYSPKASDFSHIQLPDDDMYSFINKNSEFDDVFILPFGNDAIFIPLITGRSVFFGNGFPFSEGSFPEHDQRQKMVYGSNEEIKNIAGSWIGAKYANYYRNLKPQSFIDFSFRYKLDWVVVEADYSEDFAGCSSEYVSKYHKVFTINNLKKCNES